MFENFDNTSVKLSFFLLDDAVKELAGNFDFDFELMVFSLGVSLTEQNFTKTR